MRALQEWEQGRRVPDRAARVLLTVIDRDPEAVVRALGEDGGDRRAGSFLRVVKRWVPGTDPKLTDAKVVEGERRPETEPPVPSTPDPRSR